MNHLIEQRRLTNEIECDSAGTSSYHIGSSPDSRMNIAAQKQGITLTGSARQFTVADFQKFDLILAMDRDNYRDILALDETGAYADKVQLMCGFCRTHNDTDVPDPYYGGESGFDYVINLLTDACEGLLEAINDGSVL